MSIITTLPQGAAVEGINPNLLDNWYFVGGGADGKFPINQRGINSYSDLSSFTVDRWALQMGTLSIGANGATLGANSRIAQHPENGENTLAGKTITFSVLVSSVTGKVRTRIASGTNAKSNRTAIAASDWLTSAGIIKETYTLPSNQDGFNFNIETDTESSAIVVAIKLELGDTQTLAHVENGVWVLNEIPNYAEELAKCQRYFIPYAEGSLCGSAYGAQMLNFIVPVTYQMAKNPTVGTLKVMNNNGDITSNYNQTPSYVSRAGQISVTVSSESARTFGTSGAYGITLQNISAEI